MIYCLTSRRQRTGKTLLALSCGIMLSESLDGKVVLVDIDPHGDIANIVGARTDASLDSIISYSGFVAKEQTILDNIIAYNKLDIVPASTVTVASYFVSRAEQISLFLDKLSHIYEVVLVDTVDDIYLGIKGRLGDKVMALNVLDQDILCLKEYMPEIETKSYDGMYIVNKVNGNLFPEYDYLLKLFDKTFKISEDLSLASLFNREKIKTVYTTLASFKGDKKSAKKYKGSCIPDISTLVKYIIAYNGSSITLSVEGEKPKKKGKFSLFGRRKLNE